VTQHLFPKLYNTRKTSKIFE